MTAALLLALGWAPAACGGGEGPGEEAGASTSRARPVVVSVPPLAYLAERLVGDDREVVVMVPPGASPALYEPTLEQMRAIHRAGLYVAVGHPRFPFERAWLGQIRAANPAMELVRAGASCRTEPADPHLWTSPRCVRRMVEAVADAAERIGGRPDLLRGRRAELLREVARVDARISEILSPHRGRAFLVFHPALGYLARDYGLRQWAIQRGATRPGPGELAKLIREAREAGIRTVFVQPQFSREAARLVAAELPGGRVATINPLARDWPESMVTIARRLAASFVREARP